MIDESDFPNWMFTRAPGGPLVVCDVSKRPIATVAQCSEKKALPRAALIAAAPGLYATLHAVLEVLRAMANNEGGNPAGLAAQDMIPVVEDALAGADFMGKITPPLLVGR